MYACHLKKKTTLACMDVHKRYAAGEMVRSEEETMKFAMTHIYQGSLSLSTYGPLLIANSILLIYYSIHPKQVFSYA